jgi:RNA polymerase sigma-70 factor (ECF subfamily)
MNGASDESLMVEFVAGDEKAFDVLVHKYETPLLNFLYRYLGDNADAEEVFQEAFIRVYTKRERFDATRKFKTWLYTIALNLARTLLKRRHSAPLVARGDDLGGSQDKIVLEGEAAEEYSPERSQETKELGEMVRAAVTTLPQKQREVFMLFQYQGLNYAEIAAILGRPVGTIKSQMHYAVAALREKLKEADLHS